MSAVLQAELAVLVVLHYGQLRMSLPFHKSCDCANHSNAKTPTVSSIFSPFFLMLLYCFVDYCLYVYIYICMYIYIYIYIYIYKKMLYPSRHSNVVMLWQHCDNVMVNVVTTSWQGRKWVMATSVSDVVTMSLYNIAKMLPQRCYNITTTSTNGCVGAF